MDQAHFDIRNNVIRNCYVFLYLETGFCKSSLVFYLMSLWTAFSSKLICQTQVVFVTRVCKRYMEFWLYNLQFSYSRVFLQHIAIILAILVTNLRFFFSFLPTSIPDFKNLYVLEHGCSQYLVSDFHTCRDVIAPLRGHYLLLPYFLFKGANKCWDMQI